MVLLEPLSRLRNGEKEIESVIYFRSTKRRKTRTWIFRVLKIVSVQATIAKYHIWVPYKQHTFISHSSRGWKFEIRMSECSGEGSLKVADFLCAHVTERTWQLLGFFYKKNNLICTPTSFHKHLPKNPPPHHHHFWCSGFQLGTFGGKQTLTRANTD